MAIKSISSFGHKAYIKHRIITELVAKKNVIHYGCVDDDEGLIKLKANSGYYLHKLITDSASKTLGVDLNREAFSFLKRELSVDNIVFGDVEDPATFDIDKGYLKDVDVIVIPDVIEHLSNPGMMLDGIKEYYSKKVRVIILTPNPFAWYNFVATLLNKEIYTPYHTMYFTSESMAVLLEEHGFVIDRILPVVSPKQRGRLVRILDSGVSKLCTTISPGFADLYLYECSIKR
jgi:hypothetical protein